MVNLNNFVLDCGELKSTPEINMVKLDLYTLCKQKSWRTKSVKKWCDVSCDYITHEVPNDDWKLPPPKIIYGFKKYVEYQQEWDYINYPKGPKGLEDKFKNWCGEKVIYNYLEIIPFTPSVMINISPDWKASERKLSNNMKVAYLKTIIENYLKESDRYDYYSYVIENGSEGDHIHCHIVAHINPKLLKSVETHLAKGTHTQQIKKYAKKVKGMAGIIKGVSVQKTFLRNEELVKDKLDYLIEELKPEGHKNKSVIEPGRVDKVLITVK